MAASSRALLTISATADGVVQRVDLAATGSLAPNQRPMIARLGLKALLAGSLSNLMSAALAGLILAATAAG